MKAHHFTLTLGGVTKDTPYLEDMLYDAGFADTLISFHRDEVTLTFFRRDVTKDVAKLNAAIDVIYSKIPGIYVKDSIEGV